MKTLIKMLVALFLLSTLWGGLGCMLYDKGEVGFEIVNGFKFTHEASTTNSTSKATIDFPSLVEFIAGVSDSSQDSNSTAGTGG